MAPTGIVDLPFELLDHLYSYLDWKRTEDYRPLSRRYDLLSISTVCKHLRHAAIPRLFHTVTLRLKWEERSLVEPSLYRLRLHALHLFEHVREVFVETNFQRDSFYTIVPSQPRPIFKPPEEINDWINPSNLPLPTDKHNVDLFTTHRERIDAAAKKLATSMFPDIGSDQHNSAESLISQMNDRILRIQRSLQRSAHANFRSSVAVAEYDHYDEEYQPHDSDTSLQSDENRRRYSLLRKKQQVDALAVLILCLPPSLNSVIFEACPPPTYSAMDLDQYDFALGLMMAIIDVYTERIERLAMVCNHPSSRRRLHLGTVRDEVLISSDTLSKLKGVRTLVLGSDTNGTSLADQNLTKWHALSDSVKNLELWNFSCTSMDNDNLDILMGLIGGFTGLKHLTLNNISYLSNTRRRLGLPVLPGPAPGPVLPATEPAWLIFTITVRRANPELHLHLTSLLYGTPPSRLPDPAIDWLVKEAVPRHANLGLDREQRLIEDFVSFLPLWDAESSDRGQQAAEHRKSGALVDEAMSRRGHQTQPPLNTWEDQGEWWTM